MIVDEAAQTLPEGAAGFVEENDGGRLGLPRLLKGEQLEHLVESAESAGRQMNPSDSLISMSLRVKKYFIATTWS